MTPHFLLHHLLAARAASDDQALVHKEQSLSYREFAAAAARCAAALQQAGAERGDRVVIYLPRGIEECWSIFGVSMASGVFVPVNALLKSQQIRHIVADSGAKIVISNRAMQAELDAALQGLTDVTLLLAEDIEGHTSLPARPSAAIGEDLAAILYTSGSTGSPKGVMLSHRNLLAGARIVRTYLEITARDRILSLLPFSFDYGLNQLLTAVEQGATTIISTFRLGDDIVRDLRDHAVTGLAGVPTVWAILTRAAPSLAKTPLPHLRYITNSGGRVPQETVKALREKLPDTKIYLMYGLTEAFRSTFLPPEEIDSRPTSIGKAIPECEIFIVTDKGQRAKPGEPGILVHRGPTVSLGYWNRPEDTAKVLRPHPFIPAELGGETVCYSGDLAVEDEDGFFSFVARNDAMIKSSGYRISPTEVEESLMSTGLFQQVAVIGLPDPFAGEKVHAVATAANETTDVSAALKKAAEMLAPFMIPRAIELVDRLPVTANGKVDYRALVRERTDNVAHG
ncbi:AMP-binding protein [Agrobacterium tumefaciens]|uniref:AMP-binding protein n=1 Tax=Agrobacterium tumefaciens TaxID=358 RepID=UPI000F917A60|nr:AMP-binding protein [Agrobacterium tumefaciens]NSX90793.1 AMP-binding protein [Agrobacterium tumefaciens]